MTWSNRYGFTPTPGSHGCEPVEEWRGFPKGLHGCHGCKPVVWGFTLVELLVTTSLMAIVGGTMVSALATGVRVWERAQALGTTQEETLVAVERLQRDLRNRRPFRPLPFEGRARQLTFAGVGPANDDPHAVPVLGRIAYALDSRERRLCRSFVPYQDLELLGRTARCQSVLERVREVHFRYFGKNPESHTMEWRDTWDAVQPPLAMKVDLFVSHGDEEPSRQTALIYFGDLQADEPEPPSSDEPANHTHGT